jgi:hypothetical protein
VALGRVRIASADNIGESATDRLAHPRDAC